MVTTQSDDVGTPQGNNLVVDSEEIAAFFQRPDVQEEIIQLLRDTNVLIKSLKEARKIDPHILHQPMTL